MPKTITGNWSLANNCPVANGMLYLSLSADAVATSGAAICAPKLIAITLNSNGSIPANTAIYANDELSPTGTTYQLSVNLPGGGKIWGPENYSLIGASPLNLNTFTAVGAPVVSYPNPILANPTGPQTITGQPLTLSSAALVALAGETLTGGLTVDSVTGSGQIGGATLSASGAVLAATVSSSGNVSGATLSSSGAIIAVGAATLDGVTYPGTGTGGQVLGLTNASTAAWTAAGANTNYTAYGATAAVTASTNALATVLAVTLPANFITAVGQQLRLGVGGIITAVGASALNAGAVIAGVTVTGVGSSVEAITTGFRAILHLGFATVGASGKFDCFIDMLAISATVSVTASAAYTTTASQVVALVMNPGVSATMTAMTAWIERLN